MWDVHLQLHSTSWLMIDAVCCLWNQQWPSVSTEARADLAQAHHIFSCNQKILTVVLPGKGSRSFHLRLPELPPGDWGAMCRHWLRLHTSFVKYRRFVLQRRDFCPASYCRISVQVDALKEGSSSSCNTFNALIHWLLSFDLTFILLPPFPISRERDAVPRLPRLLLSLWGDPGPASMGTLISPV